MARRKQARAGGLTIRVRIPADVLKPEAYGKLTSTYQSFELRAVFDPADDIAVEIAQLAVIAEDMRIIATALARGSALVVDRSQRGPRNIEHEEMAHFFWRAWLVALQNALPLLKQLGGRIRKQPRRFDSKQERVNRFILSTLDGVNGELGVIKKTIERARNIAGGHLDPDHVRRVLARAAPGERFLWSAGSNSWDGRFNFARHIAVGIFNVDLEHKGGARDPAPEWAQRIGPGISHVWTAIQNIVSAYLLANGGGSLRRG